MYPLTLLTNQVDFDLIMQEVIHIEKAKKSILLGSLQSLHIEAFTDEAIKIEVQDVCPGWTLQTAPKVTLHTKLDVFGI